MPVAIMVAILVSPNLNSDMFGQSIAPGAGTVAEPLNGQERSSAADKTGRTVADIDGNVYSTVKIGEQVWMGQNLAVTRYNDGTAIPLVSAAKEWAGLDTPAFCWYNNDPDTYGKAYGALYNWYTLQSDKLCPAGWHLPADDEWQILLNQAGGSLMAGTMLKEKGLKHWISPNSGAETASQHWDHTNPVVGDMRGARNETGFTALPGGYRLGNGFFLGLGAYGIWWSTTEGTPNSALRRTMYYNFSDVRRYASKKQYGASVRCLKD